MLLADLWRPGVNYSGLSKNGDALTFMRTYASDSWTDYKRKTALVNPNGAGDYMPASAQNMAVSAQAETITVTIPQGSGITALVVPAFRASLSVLRLLMLRVRSFQSKPAIYVPGAIPLMMAAINVLAVPIVSP